jgi:hypothetical protein
MKILLLIFILTFSFQSLLKADDIRDFQIEGISIGDSALDYFSKSKIKKAKKYTCKNKVYKNCEMFTARMGPIGIYTGDIQLNFKKNDPNFIIYSISGTVRFINDIKNCYPKKKVVSQELESLFPNAKKKNKKTPHAGDKTGKSKTDTTIFYLPDGSIASVACYDWSKKMKYNDHLRVSILSKEYKDWLNNKAYK